MRTIETQVNVTNDHLLNIQLPDDIEVGQYKVVIVMNPQAAVDKNPAKPEKLSFADAAQEFIGCLDSDIEDLSHNPQYLEGFGK
ncbi:MAG: hypothetical protein ACRC80_39200 [Waterburya sp.]